MANDLFKWEDRFRLDVRAMDADHKVLIGLMNTLHAKYEAKAPASEQEGAFKALTEFTVKHFTAEEAYMASVKFPGLDSHKVIHKNLLQKMADFAAQFGKTRAYPAELFHFLKTWLAAHIVGIDTKYAAHASAR